MGVPTVTWTCSWCARTAHLRDSWEEQRFVSGQHLQRLTGNSVSWFDISRSDLVRSVEMPEPLVAEWLADGIHLVGQPLRALVRSRPSDEPAETPARLKGV